MGLNYSFYESRDASIKHGVLVLERGQQNSRTTYCCSINWINMDQREQDGWESNSGKTRKEGRGRDGDRAQTRAVSK